MMETKKKINSYKTKQEILDSAFINFLNLGFESATLEKIAKDAKVTRGAVYWHFEDKEALFKETVLFVLDEIDKYKIPIFTDHTMSDIDKIIKLISIPSSENNRYLFLQKNAITINLFEELSTAVNHSKVRLLDFMISCSRNYFDDVKSQAVGSMLFSYFEGTRISDLPIEIRELYTPEKIRLSIETIFKEK